MFQEAPADKNFIFVEIANATRVCTRIHSLAHHHICQLSVLNHVHVLQPFVPPQVAWGRSKLGIGGNPHEPLAITLNLLILPDSQKNYAVVSGRSPRPSGVSEWCTKSNPEELFHFLVSNEVEIRAK